MGKDDPSIKSDVHIHPLPTRRLNVLPDHTDQAATDRPVGLGRFPSWLHRRLPKGGGLCQTEQVLGQHHLHTVCEEARCPNLLDCWTRKTATFLVMGKACTRNCGFCDIDFSKSPQALDQDEPERIAQSVVILGLKHVVITMVARDDLSDGGAAHLVAIVGQIRKLKPTSTIELLTSDFDGNRDALDSILNVKPEIFNHNIETVSRLSPRVRHKATYQRTLEVLNYASSHRYHPQMKVKSGLMLGLGEEEEEVQATLRDLKNAGCDVVTLGQYLQPNRNKLLVKAFIPPEQFKKYETYGHSIGIRYVYAGPFVRSSYNADLVLSRLNEEEK